jgi:hypothetical protein
MESTFGFCKRVRYSMSTLSQLLIALLQLPARTDTIKFRRSTRYSNVSVFDSLESAWRGSGEVTSEGRLRYLCTAISSAEEQL